MTTPPSILIANLLLNQKASLYLRVTASERRLKKDGSPFLIVNFQDKSGKIEAKIWERADEYGSLLVAGQDFKVAGLVTSYQGKMELKIDTINPVKQGDEGYDAANLVESAPFEVEACYQDLLKKVGSRLQSVPAKALLRSFDREYGQRFRDHYGAQRIHHAHRGGLLAHTHQMVEVCLALAPHYAVDIEVVLLGALFHDLGKLDEFTITPAVAQTPAGGLLGHIVLGLTMFRRLLETLPDVPAEWALQIEHIIVSHHGEKEFGSPEVPKTPEALLLHLVDLLDSKMGIFTQQLREDKTPGPFTDYVRVLGRNLYRSNSAGSLGLVGDGS